MFSVSFQSLVNVPGLPIVYPVIILDSEDEKLLAWRRRQGVIE